MFIGTLSLNINTHDLNYGAVLHSWAFQQILLKKFYAETEIIDYITPRFENIDLKYREREDLKNNRYKHFIINTIKRRKFTKKYDKFKRFIAENLIVSKRKYNQQKLNEARLLYDTIICESDVIWSSDFFLGELDRTFFCALKSMKNMNKISYAASMANGDLSTNTKIELKEFLKSLDYISCRESYAVKLVKMYTDKEVYHVIDPVLLLDSKDYEEIIKPVEINEPYILIYLPVGQNINVFRSAQIYSRRHNLKIIEISDSIRNIFRHKVIRDAGIGEFLSLIKNAEVIFSDSFHAVCFSILFQKNFYAFARKTGRKIEDICKVFSLEERYISGENNFFEQSDINYCKVEAILLEKKKKSMRFLKKAILKE